MFFEFRTKKNESVTINVSMILFITPNKKGTTLIDCEGNIFESNESYESFISRLEDIVNPKCV